LLLACNLALAYKKCETGITLFATNINTDIANVIDRVEVKITGSRKKASLDGAVAFSKVLLVAFTNAVVIFSVALTIFFENMLFSKPLRMFYIRKV
jgi:hypothetical protein